MVEYSFTAVAVMLATQDIAVPEPGVLCERFPSHRQAGSSPVLDDSPHLFLRTAIALNHSQTPETHTRHLNASSRVSQLSVTHSGAFMLLGDVYAVTRTVDKIGSIHNSRGIEMEHDKDKVDDVVLALIYLGMFSERSDSDDGGREASLKSGPGCELNSLPARRT